MPKKAVHIYVDADVLQALDEQALLCHVSRSAMVERLVDADAAQRRRALERLRADLDKPAKKPSWFARAFGFA